MQVKTVAGDYTMCSDLILEQLVNYLTCGKHPDHLYAQALLRKALPNRKCIHQRDIWNTRVRAKMLIKSIKAKCSSIETFDLKKKNPLDLVEPLDNLIDNILDDAVMCAEEFFSKFIKFQRFLQCLKI